MKMSRRLLITNMETISTEILHLAQVEFKQNFAEDHWYSLNTFSINTYINTFEENNQTTK